MPRSSLATALFLTLGSAALLPAQTWVESSDAGDRIDNPNITVGTGPLARIDGALGAGTSTAFDVDLFLIRIDDPATFTASSVGGTTLDTQLWLFDRDGYGISFRDDQPGSLQSTLTGQFVPGPGVYLLGISQFDNDARDQAFQEIWLDQPYAIERAPDGPATGPLFQWNANAGATPAGNYTITLGGATFASEAPSAKPDEAWVWVPPSLYPGQTTFVPYYEYQHQPSNEPIRVTRIGTGQFRVDFSATLSDTDAMFEASTYDGNHAVVIQAWYPTNGKLACFVDVYDTGGNFFDGAFTLRYRSAGAATERAAFCWANDSTNPQYVPAPSYSWNGNRADPSITRYAAGLYRVRFPSLGSPFVGGTFGATAYSGAQASVARRAQIDSWGVATGSADLDVFVRTFDLAGNQVDSRFVVSYHSHPGTTADHLGSGAYVYGNQPGAASYSGPSGYTASNGTFGPNTATITRLGLGNYRVALPGVTYASSSVANAVSRMQDGSFAAISAWSQLGTGTSVRVRTYDKFGSPADAEFFLNYDTNLPAGTPATNTVIGAGCGGLTLTPTSRPVLSSPWGVALTSVPPSALLGLVMVGFNNPNLEIGFLGAPGCFVHQDLVVIGTVFLPAPSPSYTLSIPNQPNLLGATLYAQGAAFDATANAFGIVTSNGIAGTIGDV